MSTIDTVRVLIPDLGETPALTDGQLQILIDLNNADVRLAAADALDIIATDEALTFRVLRTDDLSVDGTKGAALLLDRARRLREAVLTAESDYFQIVYPVDALVVPELSEYPSWL